jgi:hypothetical protein
MSGMDAFGYGPQSFVVSLSTKRVGRAPAGTVTMCTGCVRAWVVTPFDPGVMVVTKTAREAPDSGWP